MRVIIMYDNEGYILSIINGDGEPVPREPVGVPFLWAEIPEGKRIKITDGIGVDVSVTPHQVILEDIPPTTEEKLTVQITDLKEQQLTTERLLNENTLTQQELLEFLIESGVL